MCATRAGWSASVPRAAGALKKQDAITLGVLLHFQYSYGRDVLRGIASYKPQGLCWQLDFGDLTGLAMWLATDRPMIAMLGQDADMRLLHSRRAPIVNVSGVLKPGSVPLVTPDNVAVGRLAAEHLLSLGYTNFAFVGAMEMHLAELRFAGFSEVLARAGFDCTVVAKGSLLADDARLTDQPLPLAVMADNDVTARQVIRACQEAGRSVPGEVSVIGVDDDELVAEAMLPPLTSVSVRGFHVGVEAARLMNRLLLGEPPPKSPVLITPYEVVVRATTVAAAYHDPLLRRALSVIRERACAGITVQQVANAVGRSRRGLQDRFHRLLGESVQDEILRVRMAEAKRLLRTTDKAVIDVGLASGFAHSGRFSVGFHRAVGMTPSSYRKNSRVR